MLGQVKIHSLQSNFLFSAGVQEKVKKIFNRYEGSGERNGPLNKYCKQLAEMKWDKNFTSHLKTKWYDVKKELKPSQIDDEDSPYKHFKYQMLFVRAIHPCYQLKFTS